MYNHVVLVGRLVADPQKRFSSEGTTICTFTIAVDRPSSSGEADFIDIVSFGNLAEIASKYLEKGRLVLVEGRLRTRYWERNDGTRQKVYEVHARDIRMLDSRKRREREDREQPTYTKRREEGDLGFDIDDISELPF